MVVSLPKWAARPPGPARPQCSPRLRRPMKRQNSVQFEQAFRCRTPDSILAICPILTVPRGGCPPMDDLDRRLIALLRARRARHGRRARQGARRGARHGAEPHGPPRGGRHDRGLHGAAAGPHVEEQRIRALMTIAVEGNRIEAVIAALRGDPAVAALHTHQRPLGHRGRAARRQPRDVRPGARAGSASSTASRSTETSLLLSTFKL